MGGPEKPQLSPEQLRLQEQARADRIQGIQDRVTDDTRDLLVRFGRNKAMAGVSSQGLSGGPGIAAAGSLGLFGGRKLGLLSALGKV
jgi:hypothetical protein